MFMYLDPPYMLSEKQREKLYGKSGDSHAGFDHEGLFEIIKDRKNWVMSYGGESKAIFEIYKDFEIIDLSGKWTYGMKNVQSLSKQEIKKMDKSSEILIKSK